MAITFYYGAGSPYAWRVWLALEHKQLPYQQETLSFLNDDLRKPDFLALNPRHKVPVLVDDTGDTGHGNSLVLFESSAIVSYLEDAYPDRGSRLFPGEVRERAMARRMVAEIDNYVGPTNDLLVHEILFKRDRAEWDHKRIDQGRAGWRAELANFERDIRGDFLAGQLSAADFSLYPMLGLALRMEKRHPDLDLTAALGPKVRAWKSRVEALPYFQKTWPAHWK